MEIIHFANEVLGSYAGEVKPAEPVFRSGKLVQLVQVQKDRKMEWIKEVLRQFKKDSRPTIALVTRDDAASSTLL